MREALCYLLLGSVSGATPSFCLVCFKLQLAYIKVLKHSAYELFAFRFASVVLDIWTAFSNRKQHQQPFLLMVEWAIPASLWAVLLLPHLACLPEKEKAALRLLWAPSRFSDRVKYVKHRREHCLRDGRRVPALVVSQESSTLLRCHKNVTVLSQPHEKEDLCTQAGI